MGEDRTKILDTCNETIKWLDMNQLGEKEEYEHKQKEIEQVCNPIITKMYAAAGGAPLVACPVVPLMEPLVPVPELVAPLDPPSRKSTKLIHCVLCITRNTFHNYSLIIIIPHCYKSCDFVVGLLNSIGKLMV